MFLVTAHVETGRRCTWTFCFVVFVEQSSALSEGETLGDLPYDTEGPVSDGSVWLNLFLGMRWGGGRMLRVVIRGLRGGVHRPLASSRRSALHQAHRYTHRHSLVSAWTHDRHLTALLPSGRFHHTVTCTLSSHCCRRHVQGGAGRFVRVDMSFVHGRTIVPYASTGKLQ